MKQSTEEKGEQGLLKCPEKGGAPQREYLRGGATGERCSTSPGCGRTNYTDEEGYERGSLRPRSVGMS